MGRLAGKQAFITAAGQGCAAGLEAERYLADKGVH
jgi:thioredoxin reductase